MGKAELSKPSTRGQSQRRRKTSAKKRKRRSTLQKSQTGDGGRRAPRKGVSGRAMRDMRRMNGGDGGGVSGGGTKTGGGTGTSIGRALDRIRSRSLRRVQPSKPPGSMIQHKSQSQRPQKSLISFFSQRAPHKSKRTATGTSHTGSSGGDGGDGHVRSISYTATLPQSFREHDEDYNHPRQRQDIGFMDHVNKLRTFIRRQIKSDIPQSNNVFDSIKGLLPRNSSRNAFDANVDKCRHLDVICVDQNRIILNCAGGFIHANRVSITDGSNDMIVTQLPLKHTVMDFWRMIWDENVQSVLMILTQNEWNHYGRSLRLLPDWRGCLHKKDGLCIAFQHEYCVSPMWSVTFYGISWDGVQRSVQWIHYTGWAHGQAPTETTSIWQIHSYLRRSRRPIVCMSMSGAGRAGSYAVLEMAHERIHNRNVKRVSLVEYLQSVRDSRMHAMQNRIQFNFVQMALVDHLLASEKVRNDLNGEYLMRYKKMRSIKFNHAQQVAKESLSGVRHY